MIAMDSRSTIGTYTCRIAGSVNRGMILIPITLIRFYQGIVRPLLIGSCKFCPSCSEYAIEALQRHGLLRGSCLALRRLCRCHPFSPGGIDPVPDPVVPQRQDTGS